MPRCSYCHSNFLSFQNLKLHLMGWHHLTATSPVRCGEPHCFDSFSKMKKFEKHFFKVHNVADVANVANVANIVHNDDIVNEADNNVEEAVNEVNELQNIANNVNLRNFVTDRSSKLVSKLYCHPTIPQNAVQMILEESEGFAAASLSILKSKVNEAFLKPDGPTAEDIQEINNGFSVLEKPFEGFDTEYKRIKFFTNKGLYIPGKEIPIGRQIVKKRIKRVYQEKLVDITAQLIPLRDTLKLFFSYKKTLEETLDYMNQLNNDDSVLSNVIQGSEWRKTISKLRETRPDDIFLPLSIYNDEYEICNPLGTHRKTHKLSAIYGQVPCLPPKIQSSLNSIFLCQLFQGKYRNVCGNEATFEAFIDELNFLSNTGIQVEVQGEVKHLFFVVSLLVADNLGMNQMLGLVECFVANHPCRICRLKLDEIQILCWDDPTAYRNSVNYEEDLQLDDYSATGVKTRCVWNRVENFHFTTNCAGDAMHDVLEGSAGLDIIFVLHSLIDAGYFTLQELNLKVADFDFGVDCKNKPPDFADVFTNDSLSLSASEMLVIIRYLPLIVGQFIPRNNRIWELFLLLRECTDLIFAPSLQRECVDLLKTLIEEHHSLYRQLTKRPLTFKQHMMTHYPNLFLRFGPPRKTWCIHYERKHYDSKRAACALICRKNAPKSVTKKHGLRSAHYYNSSSLFHDALDSGPRASVAKQTLEQRYNVNLQNLPNPCEESSWISIYGIVYKSTMMLPYAFLDDLPCFAYVTKLLIFGGEPYFLCSKYKTITYDRHYCAYLVEKTDTFIILNQSQLLDPCPLSRSQVLRDFYVTLKYQL